MSSSDKVRPLGSFNHKDIFTPKRLDMVEITIGWEWWYIPLKTPLRGSIRDRTHDVA